MYTYNYYRISKYYNSTNKNIESTSVYLNTSPSMHACKQYTKTAVYIHACACAVHSIPYS